MIDHLLHETFRDDVVTLRDERIGLDAQRLEILFDLVHHVVYGDIARSFELLLVRELD